MTYQEKKEKVREEIEELLDHLNIHEIPTDMLSKFEDKAKKYGLLKELRDNSTM